MTRRDFYRFATVGLGTPDGAGSGSSRSRLRLGAIAEERVGNSGLRRLTRLSQFEVGVPRSFAIIEERQDAWVKYPREPVGSVWLIRQPRGKSVGGDRAVLGVSSPGLRDQPDRRWQGLPVPVPHQLPSTWTASPRTRSRPARWIDSRSRLGPGDDPEVRVKFQRFRTHERGEDPPCLSNWPTGSTIGPASAQWITTHSEDQIPGGRAGGMSSVRP